MYPSYQSVMEATANTAKERSREIPLSMKSRNTNKGVSRILSRDN
jgi:hypothetical protein